MKLNRTYWVRMIRGTFPMVFFDTKKDCEASFKNFYDKKDYKAVRIIITEVK